MPFSISSQVNDEIGYDVRPAALVMLTRKSLVAVMLAPAAAALTVSRLGSTQAPAAFLRSA